MNQISSEIIVNDQKITLETGKVARQANGAVMASCDGTTVLATVAAKREAAENQSFFPLSVNYQEKTYAAGKIPGGFFKREGRPSEKETLISRLIDRPLRPSFRDDFLNEVQVVITVMSLNPEVQTDVISMIAASAALSISDIPFNGPIAGVRVGYIDNKSVINPTVSEMENSALDLVVAGSTDAILMVESEAKELSEDVMLNCVMSGHNEIKKIIDGINDLVKKAGKEKWILDEIEKDQTLKNKVKEIAGPDIESAYSIVEKSERSNRLADIKKNTIERIAELDEEISKDDITSEIKNIEKETVRTKILNGEPRIDGRDTKTVRKIEVETGVLGKAHGSALFTRGETQALVVTTLGPVRDSQIIEDLSGSRKDPFMLHYNFPPYSVGEAGFMSGPKRREIGHGRLARRGVAAVMPNEEDFPYAIRVVSEITESNGSSSMASVCGSSLSMMDAGVPLSAPVAGIAMGLIKEGDRFAVLTDILGDEDHLGDMDFKVAGTAEGVTALQMDIKIQGITEEIMEIALEQANAARIHILNEMNKVIATPRENVSENAPSMAMIKIDPDKIRDVIGKGGAVIRSITEETEASVDIDDDGNVRIYGENAESRDAALEMINSITAEAEVGKLYKGKVARIVDFGAFVTILPGKDGLVHISQIAKERVENVTDHLKEGEEVVVKCTDLDARGRIKLSIKEISEEERAAFSGAD